MAITEAIGSRRDGESFTAEIAKLIPTLRGGGGWSSEQSAAMPDGRPRAVKSRVSRAREAMRSMLEGRAPLKSRRDKGDVIAELAGELAILTAHPLSNTERSAKIV